MRAFSLGVVIALVLMSIAACGGGAAAPGEGTDPPAVDTTAPRITSITGVSNGSMVSGLVHVEVSATDENGVVMVDLLANGGLITSAAGSKLAHNWETAGMAPGMYVLTAIASDAAGNDGSDSIYVYVMEYEGEDYVVDGDQSLPKPGDPVTTQPAGPEINVDLPETTATDNTGEGDVVNGNQPVTDTHDPITTQPVDPESEDELPDTPEQETPTWDIPRLIVSGLTDGQVIFGQHHVSVVGFSEIGIDAIVLLIDDIQVASTRGTSLDYAWDTEASEDGLHHLTYFVRDLAGTVGKLQMQATIDNINDYSPPELQIESSYWECNGISGPVYIYFCGTEAQTIAEHTFLVFEALDRSEIDYFEVIVGDAPSITSDEPTIEVTLDAEYWDTHDSRQDIYMTARDEHGYEATRHTTLECVQENCVMGNCPNHDGELIYGVDVYLLAGAIPNPADCDPDQAIAETMFDQDRGYWFLGLEVGVYTVYFQYSGLEACQVAKAGPGFPQVDPSGFVYQPLD